MHSHLSSLFLCGDFLQLPPVDVPSLAIPWDDLEKIFRSTGGGEDLKKLEPQMQTQVASEGTATTCKDNSKAKEKTKEEQALAEHRGGT